MTSPFEKPMHFAIVGIPLNRPDVIRFLQPPTATPRGAKVYILDQRPTLTAELDWIERMHRQPSLENILSIDRPENHLVETHTDRLVPLEFFADASFLTRNLGGWSAIFFGVMALPDEDIPDPLLDHLQVLAHHGRSIRTYGADAHMVQHRLADEIGATVEETAAFFVNLHDRRPTPPIKPRTIARHIDTLYTMIANHQVGQTAVSPPIPQPILLDELLSWLVRLEQIRRNALANDDPKIVHQVSRLQQTMQEQTGLQLILKGEYIVGRSRRSTVMIAPELGVVVKQPVAEPFHEIQLDAKSVNGRSENWPILTHDQSLVTARGRVRLTLEEDKLPRLYQAFSHPLTFSSLLGLTIEPFVVGKTTQEHVQADPDYLTEALYETYLLHQMVAEAMKIENGDWHAANFVVRESNGEIVHIDWGAARPLRAEEMTPDGEKARLRQVRNIAYSFNDEAIAEKAKRLHDALVADERRMAQLRARAQTIALKG